jgi:hypothetical protein
MLSTHCDNSLQAAAGSAVELFTGFSFYFIFCRPVSTPGVNKVDMSEDVEPCLSKVDVVLTFAVEVNKTKS